LLVYQYRDPAPEIRVASPAFMKDNLQESLGGYVRYSLSEFPVSALLNDGANPFPLASAIALKYYIGDTETDFFYQPYHQDITVFRANFPNFTFTNPFPPGTAYFFRESEWDNFTSINSIDPGGRDRQLYRNCIDFTYECR